MERSLSHVQKNYFFTKVIVSKISNYSCHCHRNKWWIAKKFESRAETNLID